MFSLDDSIATLDPWLRAHGYTVFVLALALENVLFTSMIVPGLIVLIVAGFLAADGTFDVRVLLALGAVAAWTGDAISYAIGRLLWGPLLQRTRFAPAIVRFRPLLETRGRVFLVLYHFEPIARTIGGTLAGAMRLAVGRWLPYDFLGAALWVTFYTMVGFLLGYFRRSIDEWEAVRPLSALVTLMLVAWLWTLRRASARMLSTPPSSTPTA